MFALLEGELDMAVTSFLSGASSSKCRTYLESLLDPLPSAIETNNLSGSVICIIILESTSYFMIQFFLLCTKLDCICTNCLCTSVASTPSIVIRNHHPSFHFYSVLDDTGVFHKGYLFFRHMWVWRLPSKSVFHGYEQIIMVPVWSTISHSIEKFWLQECNACRCIVGICLDDPLHQ